MIQTKELVKIFRTDEVETTALNKVNLEVNSGEFVAIMGPSGCGKSTLLNIIGLLDNPSEGELFFDGNEVGKFKERQRTNLRKGNIGFVFQSFNLIPQLTVQRNIEPDEDRPQEKAFSPAVVWRTTATSCHCPCGGDQAKADPG